MNGGAGGCGGGMWGGVRTGGNGRGSCIVIKDLKMGIAMMVEGSLEKMRGCR